jgi:alpha-L-rhamnosidase
MRKTAFVILSILANFACLAQVSVKDLLCENRTNPLGIGVFQPQFAWQLISDQRGVVQKAYEMRISETAEDVGNDRKLFSKTGKVYTDQSVHIPYNGKPLQAGKKYFWQVRVWDNKGNVSAWSPTAFWQMGLLSLSDWTAKWISPGYTEDTLLRQSPLFRKQFSAAKEIKSAYAFITAHGLYEAQINGQRLGNAYFTPGWTSYNKRLQYQVYDVTNLIKSGNNAIGVTLGSGWYRGYLAWAGNKDTYGKDISLLLQLTITYNDGTIATIVSDESWKSTTGSTISSEIYNGETIDARKEKKGWALPGYDDKEWSSVRIDNFSKTNLVATSDEPVTKHETFKPVNILTTPKGEKVIDFGQNLVGWVMLKVRGKAGDTIVIKHAEELDKEGNFYTDNLRAAKATSIYILNGKGEEYFEPHFTYYGFRYIKVDGIKGKLDPEDFTAVALYADMKETGTFTTSNALINRLQHNILWGQKGNFLDVPTDCPQRDERLGWTGDAQVFSRTASFNMDVNSFFDKWMKDVAADQLPNGSVPHVIPNVLHANSNGSAGWADVATIIPWNMYLAYGDKRILEQQYQSMKEWVGYMEQKSKNYLWNTGTHFGDWLSYAPDNDRRGLAAITDKYLIAQCFFAHSTQLTIDAAHVLGKTADVVRYTALLRNIKNAFVKEYVTPNGRLISGTQTAYVLALNFDMLPENLRIQAADRLVQNIRDYKDHLTTGFLGTPYLCAVLTRFGHTDVAYRLLLQETYPSWLYPVKMGATTIWERWDGIKPDSTFQTPTMNSFNHYAYGAIGDWMYRSVAGIDTYEDGPGYKHIMIKPHIGGDLSSVKADLETYYGLVSSSWEIENGHLRLLVEIPANTKASIFIPAGKADRIQESGNALAGNSNGIKVIGAKDGYVEVEAGSGKYSFTIK